MSFTIAKKRAKTANHSPAQQGPELLIEGSPEFEAKQNEMLAKVCAKYAWVAQQHRGRRSAILCIQQQGAATR
jgi:hypothetical protein